MNIAYGFSTRHDGDMRLDENVRRLGIGEVVTAQQVHGVNFSWVRPEDHNQKISGVDALLYQAPIGFSGQVTLGIRTADCVPLLLYDEVHGLMAAIHAGWRGTLGEITSVVVKELYNHGATPDSLCCVIGPHIRACCYTVPSERAELFSLDVLTVLPGGQSVDLAVANRIQLQAHQIPATHIVDVNICTSCNVHNYYSYRKDTKESFGEMLGFITLSRYN